VTRRSPLANDRVRVLYCEANTDGTVGGSYYSLLFLVEGLKNTRYDPIAVFHRDHRLLPRYSEVCGEVLVVPQRPATRFGTSDHPSATPLRVLQRGLNLAKLLATARDYASLLRQRGVGLVHLNNSLSRSHEWMLASLWTKTPCIVHQRGIPDHFPRIARLLAPRLASIVCISKAVEQNLLDHGVSSRNLRTIYNGLDPARLQPGTNAEAMRKALGLADQRRVVGVIGNIKEWKGQEVMVRALPAVIKCFPEVACLLVGATSEDDRYYEERLRQLVIDLGVAKHVLFCGGHENVADFLNVLEIAVHTSITPEPFGRVLLEAMAMKKPVVGSHAGAVPEIVEEGVTGCTFPPGDSGALANCLKDLLLRPQAAAAMGQAGRARLDQFSIARNISSTLSLYGEVLAGVRAEGRS